MSDQPTPAAEPAAPQPTEPAAAAPEAPEAEQKKSLEDLLAGLDDGARSAILGEVTKARGEAANYRTKLREAEPKLSEYDRLVEASKSDLEKAQEAAAKNEARATSLLTRAVKAEVKALAAEGFADPDDAATALDPSKYATTEGDVDTEAIKADLAALLERKPHWAKSGQAPALRPNPAQGRSASPPATAAEQIAAAAAAGDTRTVMRLKAAQAIETQI